MPPKRNETVAEKKERTRRLQLAASEYVVTGNAAAAARNFGVARQTLTNYIDKGAIQYVGEGEKIKVPDIPDNDIPVEEIVEGMKKRYTKRQHHHKAKQWMSYQVKIDGPIGIMWLGDPHVDDDGCNWPLLDGHLKLCAATEGMFGASIGDAHNNWTGRLLRLYGDQDTSKETGRKLVKHLLEGYGVRWLIWLLGNHDLWNDGAALLRAMGAHLVPMEEWQAKFKLVFPNKKECRIWAAHDFPGHSMWNTMHGAQRAAHMKEEAHLYICGHTHNWALHQEESASREFVYWLARARGYKFMDDYAEKLGHFSQNNGAAILTIIDPDAASQAGFVQCYADVEHGADVLTYMRSRK